MQNFVVNKVMVDRMGAANKTKEANVSRYNEPAEGLKAEIDGEDARYRGHLSLLYQGWDREAGRKWGEEFVAREMRKTGPLSYKKRKEAIIKALRLELDKIAHCVTCGVERQRANLSEKEWAFRDQCDACLEKNVRLRDLNVRYCRYCGALSRREDVLAGGKAVQTWVNGNKCSRCADARNRIEKDINALVSERLTAEKAAAKTK